MRLSLIHSIWFAFNNSIGLLVSCAVCATSSWQPPPHEAPILFSPALTATRKLDMNKEPENDTSAAGSLLWTSPNMTSEIEHYVVYFAEVGTCVSTRIKLYQIIPQNLMTKVFFFWLFYSCPGFRGHHSSFLHQHNMGGAECDCAPRDKPVRLHVLASFLICK